jgi:S-adenosylmethionine hydrolase
MAPLIVLLSDFGHDDPYVGIMKGVILTVAPEVRLVDLCHRVCAGDVLQGALQLRSAVPFFPDGTTFLAVVDPGVGGDRRPIAVRTSRFHFVGPDNGLLSLALARETVETVVHLTESRFHLPQVSQTFHGRDLFAPVAARLAQGMPVTDMGPAITDHKQLRLPEPDCHDGQITGVILGIDSFGNLSTNIPRSLIPTDQTVSVRIAGLTLPGLSTAYSDVQPGKLLALIGSQETVEIACRNGSAQDKLGVDRGQTVTLSWTDGH